MPTIAELLNRSRQELLDLSKRNCLLSIPKSKSARTIQIQDELSEEVFRLLVIEKKALNFLPGKKTDKSDDQLNLAADGAVGEDVDNLPQPDEVEESVAEEPIRCRTGLQTALTPQNKQARRLFN